MGKKQAVQWCCGWLKKLSSHKLIQSVRVRCRIKIHDAIIVSSESESPIRNLPGEGDMDQPKCRSGKQTTERERWKCINFHERAASLPMQTRLDKIVSCAERDARGQFSFLVFLRCPRNAKQRALRAKKSISRSSHTQRVRARIP